MPLPNFTITSGTAAQSSLANTAAAAGLAEPTGGLNPLDYLAWCVAELLKQGASSTGAYASLMPAAKFSTINVTAGTLAAGNITGAAFVNLTSTNATPGAQTTRTASQMFVDAGNVQAGDSYMLRITNTGAGTLTLTAGTGVTLTGTMTVATATTRDFVVTFTSSSALVIQSVSIGSIA